VLDALPPRDHTFNWVQEVVSIGADLAHSSPQLFVGRSRDRHERQKPADFLVRVHRVSLRHAGLRAVPFRSDVVPEFRRWRRDEGAMGRGAQKQPPALRLISMLAHSEATAEHRLPRLLATQPCYRPGGKRHDRTTGASSAFCAKGSPTDMKLTMGLP